MNQAEIHRALTAAAEAQRVGRRDEAARLYAAVLARAGEQPIALNALGVRALEQGDFAAAADLFRRAITADPGSPELWMNLAKAHRSIGDGAAEQASLEGALALDQRHFMALVRLAELFERQGAPERALDRWTSVLAMAGMIEQRTPALDAIFEHARDCVTKGRAGLAEKIDTALAASRAAQDPAALRRVDACIDHALGRRRIYVNQCAGMHFPFLPADEFFERRHFPWLAEIEAHTGAIRAELEALLREKDGGFAPYVAMDPGTPTNLWSPLNNKLDWSALHLWRHGMRDEAVCARCPVTAAAVEALPLADMPGRTPTVFFSILQPGTRLPPHTGVSNARTVVHLPLIVPPDCGFRVGGETRAWREGEAWAFDDTIEHEAWNNSSRPRAILIFDVWNPHITEQERALLRTFFTAADASGVAQQGATRVGGD